MDAAPLYPPLPPTATDLALPAFAIGQGSDRVGMTGVTVILCPDGVTAAAEVRGSASSTRQFDSLVAGHHVAARAHALVFAGGSAFGLAAADGVVDWLASRGHGFQTHAGVVPTVPTAILFDLAFGDPAARPTRALVEQALADAHRGEIAVGSVGAGTGATVAAAVAVNAAGDVCDPATGRIIAGCRAAPDSLELLDARRVMAALPPDTTHPWEGNTTLVAVLTDAALAKPALLKVCQMAFGGLYRTLAPALT